MSNTIDSPPGIALTAKAERVSQARSAYAGNSGGATATAARSDDTVKITGDAMQLQTLDKSIGSGPAFDNPKVAALRLAINEGRYQVDPQRVASKMLGAVPSLG